MTRNQFISQLRTYLGVPFWHKGRSRHGVDCAGLPLCAAKDLGVDLWDTLDYQEHVDAGKLRAGILRSCREVHPSEALPGDLLLFRARDGNEQHVAILTGPRTMIHSWDAAGKVCEHPLDRGWRAHLAACFRWEGWD